jgi:hypothetical protein
MGFALLHVTGGLALLAFLYWLILNLGSGWGERVKRNKNYEDFSMALRVPVNGLLRGQHTPELVQHLSGKYSSELLKNRLSDLWDKVLLVFDTLLHLGMIGGIGSILWQIDAKDPERAVEIWGVPAIFVFFKVIESATVVMCVLLTNRYPGEAKLWRKEVSKHIEQNGLARTH